MTDVEERELNMAHALRRGPGWWMDPEGNWNPPELWPESTPPLPGWVRDADGRWHASDDPPPAVEEAVVRADDPAGIGDEPAPSGAWGSEYHLTDPDQQPIAANEDH